MLLLNIIFAHALRLLLFNIYSHFMQCYYSTQSLLTLHDDMLLLNTTFALAL
jgi:hypothetical protein